MKLLHKYSEQIAVICAKYHVAEMAAFGSVVRGELNAESDIDLVVKFGQVSLDDYADNYFDLCDALEELLNRKVDLVVDKAVKNPYFREELDETKELLFAA
ncbi:MAG: nucleotidyltransferase family protein [Flavobacteriales bacterium]